MNSPNCNEAPGDMFIPTFRADDIDAVTVPVITRPGKEEFFGRLRHMAMIAEDYESTLPAALESGRLVEPGVVAPVDDRELHVNNYHYNQYAFAANRLKNAGVKSVVMEAAHVYEYQDLDDIDLRQSIVSQCHHAAVLARELEKSDISVQQVLFIDDYNKDPLREHEARLDEDELVALTRTTGYDPSLILKESAMVDLALSMLGVMGQKQDLINLTEVGDGEQVKRRIVLKRRNIELYKLDDNMVSCAMLDAALTTVKLSYLGEGVVNILPRRSPNGEFSYRGQQKNMRTILQEHLNVRVAPVINIFTGENRADNIAAGAHHALRKSLNI